MQPVSLAILFLLVAGLVKVNAQSIEANCSQVLTCDACVLSESPFFCLTEKQRRPFLAAAGVGTRPRLLVNSTVADLETHLGLSL
jgi:hypothetical protein